MARQLRSTFSSPERGSSLLEAVIATAIVVTALGGIAQLLLISRRMVWESGVSTTAAVLAAQKLEQLRSLRWAFDPAGRAIGDESTDLSTDPPSISGSGLRASPAGTLRRNVVGFVDYLDAHGAWCGNAASPPPAAVFVRRWAIAPLLSDPLDSLALHVVVLPLADAAAGDGVRSRRAAALSTIRTRGVQ
jgi:hypothetical protein